MSNFTFDENTVSDLHKDAYGFRPSQSWWYGWTNASDEGKQVVWDNMIEAMNASIDEEKESESRAVVAFEVLVTKTIDSGARTREDALRWIMEASGMEVSGGQGDWEYLCYLNGLPYHYFKKVA